MVYPHYRNLLPASAQARIRRTQIIASRITGGRGRTGVTAAEVLLPVVVAGVVAVPDKDPGLSIG